MTRLLDSIKDYFQVEDTFVGYFNNIEFWLNILGLNIFDVKWFTKMNFARKFMCSMFVSLIFICTSFAFICGFTTYKDSLEDQLSSCLAGFFAFEIGIKTLILFYKRDSYRKIKNIVFHHIKEGSSGEDVMFQEILIKYQEFTKFIFHLMVKLYLLAVTFLITFPFLIPKPWIYPVNFVIPGVALDSYPGYAINYIFISINSVWATIFFIGFDCYIIVLSLFLASRFELCGKYFSKIGSSVELNSKEYITHGINLHSKTLKFYSLCKSTMEPIVFIELFAVILVICCEMIISLVNPFNQAILTFFSTICQIFFYCACGELVAFKAHEVSTKLYESNWYDIDDIQLKKTLIIVLNRSQEPSYFSIGNYSPLSMETFARISSITFKSFNCIRTLL